MTQMASSCPAYVTFRTYGGDDSGFDKLNISDGHRTIAEPAEAMHVIDEEMMEAHAGEWDSSDDDQRMTEMDQDSENHTVDTTMAQDADLGDADEVFSFDFSPPI